MKAYKKSIEPGVLGSLRRDQDEWPERRGSKEGRLVTTKCNVLSKEQNSSHGNDDSQVIGHHFLQEDGKSLHTASVTEKEGNEKQMVSSADWQESCSIDNLQIAREAQEAMLVIE